MTSVARKSAYFRRSASTILPFPLTTKHHERLESSLGDLVETVLQCYVNNWYPSISPRDKALLPHLYRLLGDLVRSVSTEIVACTDRGASDQLILVDLPEILASHLINWRRAEEDVDKCTEDYQTSSKALAARFSVLYGHDAIFQRIDGTSEAPQPVIEPLQQGANLLPNDVDQSLDEAMSSSLHGDVFLSPRHPSIASSPPAAPSASVTLRHTSAVSASVDAQYDISSVYLSTLCDRLLKHHLSPKDYASPTERAIVTEILASAVLSNVIKKLSQGWMLTKIALALLGDSKVQDHAATTATTQVASVLLTVSRWYTTSSAQWKLVTRSIPIEHVNAANQKQWMEGVPNAMDPVLELLAIVLGGDSPSSDQRHSVREIMTWVKMAGGPLGVGKYADKLLPLYLHEHIFTPAALTRVSSLLQDMLFPNGQIAPSTPDPSEEEVADMNARLVARLTNAIPAHPRLLMFGTDLTSHSIAVERMISPFRNSDTNLHLIVRMVEAAILTIDPRLAKDN